MSQRPLVAKAANISAMRARDDVTLAAPSRSYARMAMRRFRANPLAVAGLVILIAMILMALGADLISSHVTGHTTYEQSPAAASPRSATPPSPSAPTNWGATSPPVSPTAPG